jgi:hypothetical protein
VIEEDAVDPPLPPASPLFNASKYGPQRRPVDEDVVDAPGSTSTIGLNNALVAITPYTSVSDWVA